MQLTAPAEPKWHPMHGHLQALDGVRGLAILMVILSHGFEANYQTASQPVRFLGYAFFHGFLGVDLFFVLSGFLITGILSDSLGDHGYFRKFYARRALRIFPLYYGVLLVILLLTHPLHLHWHGMGWMLIFYLQNLEWTRIGNFSPGANIGLYHFWSLAVEEQFYLVWPAVVFFVRSRRSLLIVTLVGSFAALALRFAFVAGGLPDSAVHVTTLCRADSLLLGGALAMLYRSQRWPSVQRIAPWGFLCCFVTIVSSILFLEPTLQEQPMIRLFWTDGLRYTVLAIGFGCLIAWSLLPHSRCERFFRGRLLGFLGKYSYGIYVLHVLVLTFSGPLRAELLRLTHSKLLAVAGTGVLSLSAGILLAFASYHLYEKPFLRLKHRFDYKRKALNHSSPESLATGS